VDAGANFARSTDSFPRNPVVGTIARSATKSETKRKVMRGGFVRSGQAGGLGTIMGLGSER
jgi:hypothetical protein